MLTGATDYRSIRHESLPSERRRFCWKLYARCGPGLLGWLRLVLADNPEDQGHRVGEA